jgi:hypothetical protein
MRAAFRIDSGVKDQMFAAGPATLAETVFYSRNGSKVSVPSSWFGSDGVALGLSRSEMDERLLRRADAAGATVLEDAQVTDLVFESGRVQGVTLKARSQPEDLPRGDHHRRHWPNASAGPAVTRGKRKCQTKASTDDRFQSASGKHSGRAGRL